MNAVLDSQARASYTAAFLDALAGPEVGPGWLRAAREKAFDAFLELGWPHAKQEEWRFTDVRPLVESAPLLPAPTTALAARFDERLSELGRGFAHRLGFRDGRWDESIDGWLPCPSGLRLLPLGRAVGENAVARVLGRHLQSRNAFALLNTAFMTDGAFVDIAAGATIDAPIVLLYLAGAEAAASFPRTVIHAGAGSRATVVEIHLGAEARITLSNAVTEVLVEPGAHLAYHTLNRPSDDGFHVGHLAITQQQGSTLAAQTVVLGGRLVRNDAQVVLAAEQADCQLDGLYLASGDGHVDNQTGIDHRAPRCRSRESYRGAVSGRGQAVWSGRAVVRPGAQGTDARQVSRNLVLSDGAVVHAKPHLEIFANDVKCSHGATTGRLDPEALFYLRSRGLGIDDARRVLLAAFLREGLGAIADARLRGEIEASVVHAAQILTHEAGGVV